jgi:hypothetical protein
MVDSGGAQRSNRTWATSKTIGGVSEIAVLAPIRTGCSPGEQRTYEERLAEAIQNLAERHQQGFPTELGKISSIHFGRMIIIRPEQYLLYSDLDKVVSYHEGGETDGRRIPKRIDDYTDLSANGIRPKVRSFLLTLVEFDGDVKIYMRDVAQFLARDFDRIFENCEDYPTTRDFEVFWLWIRRYQINTNLFYAPYSNLSTVRIKQLEEFKRRFDALVAQVYSPNGQRMKPVDELFEQFVRDNQRYARDFPSPSGLFRTDNS